MSTFPIYSSYFKSETFPELLLESKGFPQSFFYQGDLGVAGRPCISIVGSRASTAYGERVARILVPELVRAGLCIVSGLAYGIDSYVHELALLNGGSCIAVLGSGLQRIYPRRNAGLLDRILESGGCAISEYAPDVGPQAYHFPARNRIVASLSPVTLIIEAGEKSGTLITAQFAIDGGRQVCVVPGDITRPGTKGILKLMKDGAHPIASAADILQLYGVGLEPSIVQSFQPALTGSLATLYDFISCGVETVEDLMVRSGLAISELQSVLSVLELDGYIYNKQNRWQKI